MRPPRPQFPTATYHVNAGGAQGGMLFVDDVDRAICLTIVAKVVIRYGWILYGYCLLGTHYHLLFMTPEANVARGMHVLNHQYARSFNRRHGSSGHVFESRYYSELVETDGHLLATYRYLALNPVLAGLCTAPADWTWSSYAGTVGLTEASSFVASAELLECFDANLDRARRQLRNFVEHTPRFS